jgi:hypothetical protein
LAISILVLVAACGGVSAVDESGTATTTTLATTTTSTTLASTTTTRAPMTTTSATQAVSELLWQKSDIVMPVGAVPSTLISDGDSFFTIIGGEVAASVDGLSWDAVTIENMPSPTRALYWVDADSASSRILLLDIEGSQASTVLIDVAAGEAHESTLPFDPVGPVEDLRGFIALNDEGEAVAFLFPEGSIGETPAFRSSDGINWSRIPAGQLPNLPALQTAALGDGFVVTEGFDQQTSTYWHSPDGRTWTASEADGTLGSSLVSWGDAAVSYVESAFGPQAISANPAFLLTTTSGTELAVDLAPLESGGTYGPVVAAGGVGIAAFTPIGPDPESWFVEFSPDGVVWVRQRLPFSNMNAFSAQPAANTDRVLVNVNGEVWVGTRS